MPLAKSSPHPAIAMTERCAVSLPGPNVLTAERRFALIARWSCGKSFCEVCYEYHTDHFVQQARPERTPAVPAFGDARQGWFASTQNENAPDLFSYGTLVEQVPQSRLTSTVTRFHFSTLYKIEQLLMS